MLGVSAAEQAKHCNAQYSIGYCSPFRSHTHNAGLTPNEAAQNNSGMPINPWTKLLDHNKMQ
jgi:hypothetical protein